MRLRTLMLTAAVAAASLGGLAEAQKIAPGLQRKLGTNAPVEVIVRFRLDRATDGKALLRDLRTQLREALGKVGRINGLLNRFLGRELRAVELWLDQSIVITAPPELIRALAALPEVELVFENFPVRIPRVAAQSTASAPAGTPWHLQKVGAPALWAAGYRGQNVRVGHLDTGVDPSQPELEGRIAGFAEFDAQGNRVPNAVPRDTAQHGTHTAGLIVGKTVGVAPEAQLLSALVLPGGEGTFAQVIAGMQWVIDPDNNAATDDGADVVALSLGLPGYFEEFVNPTENLLAAGVIPVFAAGNFGPEAGSIASPGNIPDVLTVGATDRADAVASFSSRGPARWGAPYNGSFNKPEVVAPGVAITSSFPGGGYGGLSGTSQAAPIVAGVAAVLRGASPNASWSQVKAAIIESARGLGGDPNAAGRGLVNLPAAVARLTGQDVAAAPPARPQPAPVPAPQPSSTPVVAAPGAPARNPATSFQNLPNEEARGVLSPGPELVVQGAQVRSTRLRLINAQGRAVIDQPEDVGKYCLTGGNDRCAAWDTREFPNGTYRLVADVRLSDGRSYQYEERVQISNSASPANPATRFINLPDVVSGVLNPGPSLIVEGASVRSVRLRLIDSGGRSIINQLEQGSYYCLVGGGQRCDPWDTRRVPNGSYRVVAEVTLDNGRTYQYETTVRINNP